MHRPLLYGFFASLAGLLLLFAFVPLMPWGLGVPPNRALEMVIYWAGQWLAILGMGQILVATTVLRAMAARRSLANFASLMAALGVLVALLICLLSLTNLLGTTIAGSRLGSELRQLGLQLDVFLAREVRYFMYLPLGLAVLAQLPMLGCLNFKPPLVAQPQTPRYGRVILHFLLAGLGVFFLTMWLMSAIDRNFLVGCVLATWLGSVLFVLLAMDQVSWSLPERAEPPYVR